MPNDPKFRTIARISNSRTADVVSVFVHLMVLASANATERGRTQPNAEDIASALDLETERVETILEAMEGRLISNGWLTGWNKRQPKREDGGAERSHKWRENKKLEKRGEQRDEKHESKPNATERNRTQPNAPDKIREEKNIYNTLEKTTGIVLPENSPPRVRTFESDESFTSFATLAIQFWGGSVTPEALQETWMFTWKKLDFEQKLERTQSLQNRILAGEPSRYVSLPPKYLENGSWKRPPRTDGNGRTGTNPDPPLEQIMSGLPTARELIEQERRRAEELNGKP